MIATSGRVDNHQSRWLIGRIVVPALFLLFVLYPAIMFLPPNDRAAAATAVVGPVPMQAHATDTCPPLDHCQDVAVEQALPRLPIPPPLLLAIAVILFATQWRARPRVERHDWWWSPNRRRALLQVFLI